MLVLTRKSGENIRVGSDVVVTVLSVRSGQVKLGIEAPKGITIHRGEVYERIAQVNREAAKIAAAGSAALPQAAQAKPQVRSMDRRKTA